MAPSVLLIGLVLDALVGINWDSADRNSVTVRAPSYEQTVNECLDSSREAKLRFDIQLCRKRVGWFDYCVEARTETHSISFDSVTESYRVIKDRRGDEAGPTTLGIPSRAEAVSSTVMVDGISLIFLARGDANLLGHPHRYLQLKTTFSCKGSVSTVARLSQVFTLGILNVVESDSGWMDFDLDTATTVPDPKQR